jgi:hypothetical protein
MKLKKKPGKVFLRQRGCFSFVDEGMLLEDSFFMSLRSKAPRKFDHLTS